jgi:hypothetical protein
MTSFTPRSVRGTDREAEWAILRRDIPPGLDQPLRDWIRPFFHVHSTTSTYPNAERLREIGIDLRLDLGAAHWAWDALESLLRENPVLFVDAIDWCLHHCDYQEDAEELERLLAAGSSAWRVGAVGDYYELQERINSTVEAAARTSATPGSSAAHHLAAAWSHVYSQHRNPAAGYSDAVMAVEFVVLPVVLPADGKGTLGKAITAMNDAPTKWESTLGVDGISGAVAMMQALWRQQKRHGTTDATTPIVTTQDEAEAALHLATTLVHWFDTGVIKRVGD